MDSCFYSDALWQQKTKKITFLLYQQMPLYNVFIFLCEIETHVPITSRIWICKTCLCYIAFVYARRFITHRKEDKNNQVEDENNVYPWSAGQGQSSTRPKNPSGNRHLTPTEIEAMVMKAEKEALVTYPLCIISNKLFKQLSDC